MALDDPTILPPSCKAGSRRWRIAILLCGACICAIVLIELVQWFFLPAPHALRRRPGPAAFTFHTDGRILPGISGVTHFTTESHGLRYPREVAVPKSSGVYRVFCVGGSTTECTYLDDQDAWPRVIESRLRSQHQTDLIEVINAGFSGMTSSDHVEQIEQQLVPLEPDCIVLMAGMNDHLRRKSLHDSSDWSLKKILMDHSMTVRRVLPIWRSLVGTTGLDGVYQLDPTGECYVRLRAESRALPIAGSSEAFDRLPDPMPTFCANMTRIAQTCRDNSITLVLVTHPYLYRDDLSTEEAKLLWMGQVLAIDGFQATVSWHLRGLRRLNDWTRQFATEQAVALVDAERLLPKSTASFYDDCHLNVGGSKALAEAMVEVLSGIPRAIDEALIHAQTTSR